MLSRTQTPYNLHFCLLCSEMPVPGHSIIGSFQKGSREGQKHKNAVSVPSRPLYTFIALNSVTHPQIKRIPENAVFILVALCKDIHSIVIEKGDHRFGGTMWVNDFIKRPGSLLFVRWRLR